MAARKKLVMADTTLFADIKEPKSEIERGEEVNNLLTTFFTTRLQRSAPAHGVRTILAFLGMPCRWHDEQCTLAEFSAYIVRDVMAHVDLAAEARVKKSDQPLDDAESEHESEDDDLNRRTIPAVELVDMGGGDNDNEDADVEDVPIGEVSRFPLTDVMTMISLCLQQGELASLDTKRRKSKGDLALKALDDTYASLLQQNFAMDSGTTQLARHGFPKDYPTMIALQKQTIVLAKNNNPQEPSWTRRSRMTPGCPAALLSLLNRSGSPCLWPCEGRRPSH